MTDQLELETMSLLQSIIDERLYLNEFVPKYVRKHIRMENGIVYFQVMNAFELGLTIDDINSPWKVMSLSSLMQFDVSQYEG